MDVRAKNHGRPHQKVRFCAAPVMGRNFLTQGRPGIRVRNVHGKSGPKSLCLCCFSSLETLKSKPALSCPAFLEASRFSPPKNSWIIAPAQGQHCVLKKSYVSHAARFCTMEKPPAPRFLRALLRALSGAFLEVSLISAL